MKHNNVKIYTSMKISIVDGTGPVPTQGHLIQKSTRIFTKNVVYREIFHRQG